MNPLTKAPLFERLGGRDRLLNVLRHFYADVRQHKEIGPIFAAKITDWTPHLEKLADFWSGATGGPALYGGPMPWKHLNLGLEPKHFATWLDLWRSNCRAHLPAAEAEELIVVAEQVGQRLRGMVAQHGGPVAP